VRIPQHNSHCEEVREVSGWTEAAGRDDDRYFHLHAFMTSSCQRPWVFATCPLAWRSSCRAGKAVSYDTHRCCESAASPSSLLRRPGLDEYHLTKVLGADRLKAQDIRLEVAITRGSIDNSPSISSSNSDIGLIWPSLKNMRQVQMGGFHVGSSQGHGRSNTS
jgi:hypothetical protein